MGWASRHRLRALFRSSLCVVPIACMAAVLPTAPLILWVDDQTRWTLLGIGPAGANSVLGALASSLLTFIVFAFSLLLLAVQVAGGQLSPRIIARFFERPIAKLSLGAFVFSYTYSLAALGRVGDRVPQLPLLVAVLLSLLSIALFLYLIQTSSEGLRPVTVLTGVADDTRRVIDAVYPRPFASRDDEPVRPELDPMTASRTIVHRGRSGTVLAFDVKGLAKIARQAGCTIELVPQVGDFLANGEDLLRLYGAGAGAVDEGRLSRCVALGSERTLEQDPAFGFRILVDIAIKALSPAINDPTTAVLAIDQLHHLLHLLGQRQLDTGVVQDSSGDVRLVYRTPDWDDIVSLAATEIRLYGGQSPQVTRRLQALFEHLVSVVPAERSGAIQGQMALLHRTIGREFPDAEDRLLAGVSDVQGFGSRTGVIK